MNEDRIRIGQLSPGDTALLRDLAEAAAEKACNMTFTRMGLDPDDPIKTQTDFSLMRYVGEKMRDPEFREDQAWVRRTRKRLDGIVGKIVLTVVGLSAFGAVQALWNGFKAMLGPVKPH